MEFNYSHPCFSKSSENPNLITDDIRGEILCGHCGLVLAEKMLDNTKSNPTFSKEQYITKTGNEGQSKISMFNRGITSKIGASGKDANGISLSKSITRKYNRLRTWDSRSKITSKERNIAFAFTLLDSIRTKLGLSDAIIEKAAYLYRKAIENKLIQGRTIASIIAASTYAACRETGTARSLDDFAEVTNLRRKDIGGAYRHLVKHLEINLEPHDPKNYINKIVGSIGCTEKSKRTAWKYLDQAKTLGLFLGRKPIAIAGGALYLACAIEGERISYSKMEKATKTSSHTLRKTVNLLVKSLRQKYNWKWVTV